MIETSHPSRDWISKTSPFHARIAQTSPIGTSPDLRICPQLLNWRSQKGRVPFFPFLHRGMDVLCWGCTTWHCYKQNWIGFIFHSWFFAMKHHLNSENVWPVCIFTLFFENKSGQFTKKFSTGMLRPFRAGFPYLFTTLFGADKNPAVFPVAKKMSIEQLWLWELQEPTTVAATFVCPDKKNEANVDLVV